MRIVIKYQQDELHGAILDSIGIGNVVLLIAMMLTGIILAN